MTRLKVPEAVQYFNERLCSAVAINFDAPRRSAMNRTGRITELDMKNILLCLVLLAPTLPVLADSAFPRDVQKFIDRREGCDHMRGEIPAPNEKQRMKEVNREIEKLCKGTDKQLAQLKKKYESNAPLMQRLNAFDEGIEASVTSASGNRAAR